MADIKVRGMLGPGPRDDKEISILNRIVSWGNEGIEYEADPRHREIVLDYLGFNGGGKTLAVNGDKDMKEEVGDEEELGKEESKSFRGLVAKAKFSRPRLPRFANRGQTMQ